MLADTTTRGHGVAGNRNGAAVGVGTGAVGYHHEHAVKADRP